MADELDDLLHFPAGEEDLTEHAGSMMGMASDEDDDEVCPVDPISCFFFPSRFGGGLFEGVVDDFERADVVAGLADQQVLERPVLVKVEADIYFLFRHDWRSERWRRSNLPDRLRGHPGEDTHRMC